MSKKLLEETSFDNLEKNTSAASTGKFSNATELKFVRPLGKKLPPESFH